MGKPLALNHWTNQESHYTAPRIVWGLLSMKPGDRLFPSLSLDSPHTVNGWAHLLQQLHLQLYWRTCSCVSPAHHFQPHTHQDTTDQPTGNWFPEFSFIVQYRNHWSHFETDITEGKALSNQYCIAAWSTKKATPGIQKSFYIYLLYDWFLSPLFSSVY